MNRMLIVAVVTGLSLAFAVPGCGDDNSSGGKDAGALPDSGTHDVANPADTGLPADSGTPADSSGPLDAAAPGDAASPDSSSTGDAPAGCAECVQANCAAESTACQADTACWCTFTCITTGGGEGSCKQTCTLGQGNTAWDAMILCLDSSCAGIC
jgi:hypothetical protein